MLAGGFGSAVWESLSAGGVAPPIMRIGLPDRYVTHGAPKLLHEEVGYTGERIAERVEAAVLDPRGSLARRPDARYPRAGAPGPARQPLAERGLYPSRSRAAAAVLAGEVRLGDGRALKPGQQVDPAVELVVDTPPPFVSRGGIKLANALDALGVPVDGRVVPGRRRLHRRLHRLPAAAGRRAGDRARRGLRGARLAAARATAGRRCWSGSTPARSPALPFAPSLVVDRRLLHLAGEGPAGRARRAAAAEFDCLAMVKPQFEVGRERVGKGGVVRDPALRREAVRDVALAARSSAPR